LRHHVCARNLGDEGQDTKIKAGNVYALQHKVIEESLQSLYADEHVTQIKKECMVACIHMQIST
jgi:hypothetical protein